MSGKNSVVSVSLVLDASGFTSQITKANGLVLNLNTNIKELNIGAQGAQGSAESLGGAFSSAAVNTVIWVTALEQLHQTFVELPKSILETNAEIQKTQVMLAGLSTAATDAGRKAEAKEQFDWIYDLGTKAPHSVAAIQDSFVKLKSVGIDPMKGSLQGLVDALSVFGGTDEKLRDATLAIQEMAGRGTVSLEQLRRQLGKALPDAIQQMAYSLGLTYGELIDKVKKGNLEATSALTSFFDQISRSMGGQAIQHMENLNGQFASLETSWIKLQQTIGDSGFVKEAEKQLKDLIDAMNSPMGVQYAQQYGQQLAALARDAREAVDIFLRYRDVIGDVAKGLLLFAVANKATEAVTGLTRALSANYVAIMKAADEGIAALATSYKVMTGAAEIATVAEGALTVATSIAGVVASATSVAFSALLGPISVAIFLFYQLGDAMGWFTSATDKAKKEISSGIIGKDTLVAVEKEGADLEQQIKENADKLGKASKGMYVDAFGITREDAAQIDASNVAYLQRILDSLRQKALENAAVLIQLKHEAAVQDAAAAIADNVEQQNMEDQNLHIAYAKRATAIQEEMKQAKQGSQERSLLNIARLAADHDYYVAEEKLLLLHIDQMTDVQKFGTEEEKKAATKRLADLYQSLQTVLGQEQTGSNAFGPKTVEQEKKGMSAIEQEILHMKEMTVEAYAKMSGAGTNYAKVQAELSDPKKYKDAPAALKKALLDAASGYDAVAAKEKAWASEQQRSQTAWNAITTKTTEATAKLQELDAELIRGGQYKDPMGLVTLDAELQRLRNELTPTAHSVKEVDDAIKAAHDSTLAAALDKQFMKWADSARQLNDQLQDTSKETIEANFNREKDAADEILALDHSTGEKRKVIEEDYYAYIGALREKANRDEENGFQSLARTWQDSSKAMGDAMGKWADDGTTAIAQFVTTGKLDMKSLTDEIVQDIIKIELQKALASSLGGAGNWVSSILGIGSAALGAGGGYDPNLGAPTLNVDTSTPDLQIPAQTFHTGGMLGVDSLTRRNIGMSAFAGAPRFHTGGILGADEMPIIARKGEGVFTPAQMQAMSGGMPSVTVNVINQSGQQVDADQHKPRFDGESLILDVVLRAAGRPGNFRTGLKGAISS